MFSNLLSARHGAVRLSSALVAASAFLAACDNDSQPVAPKAPPVASAPVAGDPSLSPRVSGNIVIKLTDKNQNLISTGTAQLKITGPSNNTFWMYDNDASDSDSTTGQIVLKHLSTGTWKVCEVGPPSMV